MAEEQEHEFEGAYCVNCGADEASSFATEPCEGFEEALNSHEQPPQNTEANE